LRGTRRETLFCVTRNTHGSEDDISRTISETETETETEKETIRRLRRETIELRAALNDARQTFETTLQKTEETRNAFQAENRRAVDAAVTRLTRAVRERDAANVAADEARTLIAKLEAEAFDARKAAKDASKNAERRAKRAEEEASECKAKADAARREMNETREQNERAMVAKEALIETLTVENTKLREEVVRKREGQSAVEGSEGEGSLTTRAGVSLNDALSSKKFASSYDDDDDAGFEAFTAYVLGETGGGVRKQNDADTKRSSENAWAWRERCVSERTEYRRVRGGLLGAGGGRRRLGPRPFVDARVRVLLLRGSPRGGGALGCTSRGDTHGDGARRERGRGGRCVAQSEGDGRVQGVGE
jgi:hypothetical protein